MVEVPNIFSRLSSRKAGEKKIKTTIAKAQTQDKQSRDIPAFLTFPLLAKASHNIPSNANPPAAERKAALAVLKYNTKPITPTESKYKKLIALWSLEQIFCLLVWKNRYKAMKRLNKR